MTDQTEKLLALAGQLHNLNEQDAKFATSLMDNHKRMGSLTEKQMYWVGKLTERDTRWRDINELIGSPILRAEERIHRTAVRLSILKTLPA